MLVVVAVANIGVGWFVVICWRLPADLVTRSLDALCSSQSKLVGDVGKL